MNNFKKTVMILISTCMVVIALASQNTTARAVQIPSVNYSAHVQNIGWQGYVRDGALAGTSGQGLRVESFRMYLSNLPVSGDIKYATHIQNIGWQEPRTSNQISGTTGQSLRMEAMRISLIGEIAKQYDVYYRTHVQNIGWMNWVKNGEDAGTSGRSLRMEAIEVKLVQKSQVTPPREYFTSCKEMRKVHPQGAVRGDAWYNPALDRDNDGKACEATGK